MIGIVIHDHESFSTELLATSPVGAELKGSTKPGAELGIRCLSPHANGSMLNGPEAALLSVVAAVVHGNDYKAGSRVLDPAVPTFFL